MPKKRVKHDEKENFWIGLAKDILFVAGAVLIFASVSQIAFGLYKPMFAIESGSMLPHLQIGDIVFAVNIDRTEIITYEKGKEINYTSFGDYGDVILYRPYGREGVTPIIHRAMYYVEKGDPMWIGGPPAPFAGYITKGDNPKTNPLYDQQGGISYLTPAKKEWIVGVVRFYRLPVLGYVTLIPKKMLNIALCV